MCLLQWGEVGGNVSNAGRPALEIIAFVPLEEYVMPSRNNRIAAGHKKDEEVRKRVNAETMTLAMVASFTFVVLTLFMPLPSAAGIATFIMLLTPLRLKEVRSSYSTYGFIKWLLWSLMTALLITGLGYVADAYLD
jgi:hypothetical protein